MALAARNLALVSVGLFLALVTFRSSAAAQPREIFPFASPSASKILRSNDLDSDWTEWKRTLLLGSGPAVHAPSGSTLNHLLLRYFEKPAATFSSASSSAADRVPLKDMIIEEIPLLQRMKKRSAALDDLRYLTIEDLPVGESTSSAVVGRPVKRTVCCSMDMYCFVCGKR